MRTIWNFVVSLPNWYGRVTAGPVYAAIDGLRFIAVMMVVVGHIVARPFSYPELRASGDWAAFESFALKFLLNQTSGVLLFFAISGYITAVQLRRKFSDGFTWHHYADYMIGRTYRIAPPYAIVVTAAYVFVKFSGSDMSLASSFSSDPTPIDTAYVYSLLYSYGWIVDRWPKLFVPGWSLEIEAQFYILAPFFVYSYFKISNRRWIYGLGLLLSSLLVIASPFGIEPHWRFTVIRYFSYFWVGVLASDLATPVLHMSSRTAPGTASMIATVIFLYLKEPIVPSLWGNAETYFFIFANITCIFVMLIGCQKEGTMLNAFCINRYVAFLGAACYSIYLTHQQVIFILAKITRRIWSPDDPFVVLALNTILQIPAIAVVSILFYVVVERTFARKAGPALISRLLLGGPK